MGLWRRIIQHLLPRGRAWDTVPGSMLDRFLLGLAGLPEAVRGYLDRVLLDIDPDVTRRLSDWEEQFGLRPRSLSDSERRQRLRGQWSASGGQSAHYIQSVLRKAGFPVTVHEWFLPEAEVSTTQGINTRGVLSLDDGTVLETQIYPEDNPTRTPALVVGGEVSDWRCGTRGARCGNYAADNRQVRIISVADGVLAIEDGALSSTGYIQVRCGGFTADGYMLVNRGLDNPVYPPVPTNPNFFPYVLYVGGKEVGTPAILPEDRRDDFEQLLLSVCPAQQWLGVVVTYE